jgi:GNAT superfamily N-acetyltransferase
VGDPGTVGTVRLPAVDDVTLSALVRAATTGAARGRGVAHRTLAAVLEQAAALGAREVRADTTRGNGPALAVLRALGFECARRRR